MPDVITVLRDGVVETHVAGADVLLPMAVAAATAASADHASAAAASAAQAAAQYQDMLDIQALGDDAAAIAARLPKNSDGTDLSDPTAFRGGANIQRLSRYDWREYGASAAATGAENRDALILAAAAAASGNGYVSLGSDSDPFPLERYQPASTDLIIDGNGMTIKQVAPSNAASLAIGGVYSALGAFIVGSAGAGLRLENLKITQDEAALAALPLVGAGTTYMGPVVVRRADRVRLLDVDIDAATGLAFLWRGGDDGEVRGIIRNGRATVHNGFLNDPFAGDSGSSDESQIYSPLRFRGDLAFMGSPTDSLADVQFHLTGANDFDVAATFDSLTREDVIAFRIYCNDYGTYLSDRTSKDSSIRGRARITARGQVLQAIYVEGKSQEASLDTTAYDCQVDLTGSRAVVSGDGTSATGQGILLVNAPGVTGDCAITSSSSPIIVKGTGDRLLRGEYRCTSTGVNEQALNTDASAVLGTVVLPRLVGMGTGDARADDFNLATGGGPKLYISEAPVTLIECLSVKAGSDASQGGARAINTANMRGPAVLGDIVVDVQAGAGPSPGPATGLLSSYVLSVNNGSYPFTMGKLQVISTTANAKVTKGVAVNAASHFEADVVGMPLITSHTGTSEIRGHLLSELSNVDAYENETGGTHTLLCDVESTTTRRAAVIRGGVVKFGARATLKGAALTTASPLTMTGGVAEFDTPAGAFDYTGSGAPILFDGGGKVRGDLGSHANLSSTGTLWSDSNRIAASSTVAGTRFINSSDNDWNISNGTSWYASGAST